MPRSSSVRKPSWRCARARRGTGRSPRVQRVSTLTASLSEAVSVTAVANAIVEQARIVVGAAEGELKLLGESDEQFATVTTDALETGHPVFVGSLADSHEKLLGVCVSCGR